MSPLPSAQSPSTHHVRCWMRLVCSKSAGGTNKLNEGGGRKRKEERAEKSTTNTNTILLLH